MKSNSLKRILAFLVVLCLTFSMVVSASAAEGDPSASLSLKVSQKGNTVTAVVGLTDTNVGLSGIEFKLGFDTSKLTYTEAYGKIFGFSFADADNANSRGYVYAAGSANSGDTTATGNVATFTFKVKDGASGDAAFTLISGNGSDKNSKTFPLTLPATVTLSVVDYDVVISGANMTLGNNLAMNFYIDPESLTYGDDYYAVITKYYADGRDNLVVKVPSSNWVEASGMYRVTLNKIAAKEMADKVTVAIYNTSDKLVSNVWEDSVRDYTMRTVDKAEANITENAELLTVCVDMLNYGAAAQQTFGYNTGDLANNTLSAAQLAYGLTDVEMTDSRVRGEGYYGTSLTLESNILMNVYFNNIPADRSNVKAVISFTDHYDRAQEFTVSSDKFVQYNSTVTGVVVDKLVVADCRQPVEVKVYNGETLIASATDSFESYTARSNSDNPIYESIMKFATAAYNYFH